MWKTLDIYPLSFLPLLKHMDYYADNNIRIIFVFTGVVVEATQRAL